MEMKSYLSQKTNHGVSEMKEIDIATRVDQLLDEYENTNKSGNKIGLGQLFEVVQGNCQWNEIHQVICEKQVWPLTQFVLSAFCTKIIDLPVGQSNDPPSELILFSFVPSSNFILIGELPWSPSRALNLASDFAFGTSEIQYITNCVTLGEKVTGYCKERLMQTLIVCLKKTIFTRNLDCKKPTEYIC